MDSWSPEAASPRAVRQMLANARDGLKSRLSGLCKVRRGLETKGSYSAEKYTY